MTLRWLRAHPRLAAALAAVVALRASWRPPDSVAADMTLVECLTVAVMVVSTVVVVTFAVRAGWLAARCRQAVRRLTRTDTGPALRAAIRRTAVGGVVRIAGNERTAFCAGLLQPRVYVTDGVVAGLAPDELDAVLVHERAHARRRDPLRGLLRRAAADVLFFVPITSWWAARHRERAELAADSVAIRQVGVPALAGALLSATGGHVPVTSAAFDGATDVRIAQLSGKQLATRRPSWLSVVLSFGGVVAVVSLFMCTGQAAVAALAL